jgi:hypothetical protein
MPPVLYIASAYFLEHHFQKQFSREIEDIYTGDPGPLLEGNLRLKDAINRNINRYLQTRKIISLGLKTNITVTTQKGTLLYPAVFNQVDTAVQPFESHKVAAENYSLMNEGLLIKVDTKFEHNRTLSNTLLSCYVMLSILILYMHYRNAGRKADLEDRHKRQEIERLQKLERENTRRLETLATERGNLTKQVENLRLVLEEQKKKADRNEDDLIEEIEALEDKLSENTTWQNSQREEIEQLRDIIQGYEKGRRKEDRAKVKASEAIRKRFNTLYKNIAIHDRAINGFVGLNEELKIKAEEIIHQLNENPGQVTIKRKVFGGKSQKTVLEVIFSYKGRLYFRNTKDQRIEVLAVGTKNTQSRELEFLAKL